MTTTVLMAIVGAASLLVALLLHSIALPHLRVWPLPDDQGYALRVRRTLNRASGVAIAVLSAGVLVLAVLERQSLPVHVPCASILGFVICLAGATLGISGYVTLGPRRSSGESGPLVSDGPYRLSRNPQYVGAVALLLGFAAALASSQALIGAAACSAWFLLAPIAEERWLREELGHDFEAYAASAPRYLGWPSRHTRAI